MSKSKRLFGNIIQLKYQSCTLSNEQCSSYTNQSCGYLHFWSWKQPAVWNDASELLMSVMVEHYILLKNFYEVFSVAKFHNFYHRNQELKYVTATGYLVSWYICRLVVRWLVLPSAYIWLCCSIACPVSSVVLHLSVECQECTLKIDHDYILPNPCILLI
jgi:hypothetical protein